jgi:hypothetical protein
MGKFGPDATITTLLILKSVRTKRRFLLLQLAVMEWECLSRGWRAQECPWAPGSVVFCFPPERRRIKKGLSMLPPPPFFHWILLARLSESDEWLLWVCEAPHFSHDKNAAVQDPKLLKCHWLCYQISSQLTRYGFRSVLKDWGRLLVY